MKPNTFVLLALILLLAAGLRLWNVEHDVSDSQTFSGDAQDKFIQAQELSMGRQLEARPNRLYRLYIQPRFLIGSYGQILRIADSLGAGLSNEQMRMGFNIYMVLFSLATVILVFFMARPLLSNHYQALFAALLFACLPVSVVGSLYVKEDIPLMFWFTAAVTAMTYLVIKGDKKYHLLTGVLTGLAVATKYTGIVLVPIWLVAHVMLVSKSPATERARALFCWQIAVALGLVVAAFLLFNSHVLTDWSNFREGVAYQFSYILSGHHDGTAIRGQDFFWTFYLRHAIVPGITTIVTLFFIAGIVLAIVKRHTAAILISLALLIVYFLFENSPAKPFPFFARYLHMIYPLIAVLATFAFFSLWQKLRGKVNTRYLAVAVGISLILVPLIKTVLIVDAARPDTRTWAVRWMEINLPSGSRIAMPGFRYYPHPFTRGLLKVREDSDVIGDSVQTLNEKEFQYLLVSSFEYDRYRYSHHLSPESQKAFEDYARIERELELVKEFKPRFAFQSYGQHNPVIRLYKIPKFVP